jgi:glycosyltransferase involved in cell wall biosynthesis
VNDGSTDETEKILREFGSRIRYIKQDNRGQCIARETGVRFSVNEWIALCDSDDIWFPDYLASVNELLNMREETLLTFSNFKFFDGTNFLGDKFTLAPPNYFSGLEILVKDRFLWSRMEWTSKLIDFQPIFTTGTVFLKEHLNRKGGFNKRFAREYSEDLELTLRLVADGRIGILAEPLVAIRKHSSNFSGDIAKVLRGEARILEFAAEQHGYEGAIKSKLKHNSRKRFAAAGRAGYSRHDPGLSLECYYRAGLNYLSFKDLIKIFICFIKLMHSR